MDLAIEVLGDELGAVCTNEQWEEIYDRVAALAREHRSTLVFVNTRRLVERVTRHLADRLGAERVAAHHSSLSRQRRFDAEQRLKSGELSLVVATASLELGIDVGTVDLTCLLGSPRSIATALQRVGRSGHALVATPKGRLFPLTRDQLVECAALARAARRGEIDRLALRDAPLDVLAQQVVAICASEEQDEDRLFALCRRAAPYAALDRREFDQVVDMLAEGIATRRGRYAARLHRDAVGRTLKARRGSRLAAITSGGAIPDNANYEVVLEPDETTIGSLDEDFAIESMAGDVFLLGNTSWRIRRIESGRVRVEDAGGAPSTIPFWLGEAPARTLELSTELPRCARAWPTASHDGGRGGGVARARDRRSTAAGPCSRATTSRRRRAALGAVPTRDTVVVERFFDEAGGMQLVIHAPFGGRINRAWGMALRKRLCHSFNFELQAAATDDGVLLSLGPAAQLPARGGLRDAPPERARGAADPGRAPGAHVQHPLALERQPVARPAALAERPARAAVSPAHARGGPAGRGVPGPARLPGQRGGGADRGARPPAGARDPARLPDRGDGHRRPARLPRRDPRPARSGA